MKEKDNIDTLIRDALGKEEAEFYESLEEQNLSEMMLGLFKSKMKWWSVMTFTVTFVWFGFAIYCAIQFFKVEATKDLIMYATGVMVSMTAIGMLKMWNWMQMDKNAIMREIKRIELQISLLRK